MMAGGCLGCSDPEMVECNEKEDSRAATLDLGEQALGRYLAESAFGGF